MHRRDFVKNTAISTAGFAILPSGTLFNNASKVRLGIIGVGLRGQSHLALALRRSDVEVVAICDVDQRMLGMASDVIKKSGKAVPKIFTGDAYSWRKLLELKDLDGVIIATPSRSFNSNNFLQEYASPVKILGTALPDFFITSLAIPN